MNAARLKGVAITACHFQGDTLAIVAYFAGFGRLCRAALSERFQAVWDRLARSHVLSTSEQVPRSADTAADRLAGDALRSALTLKPCVLDLRPCNTCHYKAYMRKNGCLKTFCTASST